MLSAWLVFTALSTIMKTNGEKTMNEISWQQFEVVELRAGTIIEVEDFPEARIPAYKIMADFGPEFGVKKSSAQVTDLYSKEELLGKQIVAVVNFPPKQVGPFRSEFLLTGFYREDEAVVLAVPEREVHDGAKLG
jgi:tRNA-binding protein